MKIFRTPQRPSKAALIFVSLLILLASFACGCDSQKQTMIDSLPHNVDSSQQTSADQLSDQERQSRQEALRLLLEKRFKNIAESNADVDTTKIKRKLRTVKVRDSQGEQFDVEWDEYRCKSWGGWFFHATRRGVVYAKHENDQLTIDSFFHDTPLDSNFESVQSDIFVRLWNRRGKRFELFDESIYGRFDSQKPCVVIVHGMGESSQRDWINIISERLSTFDKEMNIVAIDWSRYSQSESESPLALITLPMNTAAKIPYVAEKLNEYLFGKSDLHLAPEKTHLIGFSHGAHVVGLLGSRRQGKVKRITILDPSTSKVHWGTKNRFGEGWNIDSAQFIDMYRTSGWAGTGKARGYKVFYVLEKGASLHSTLGVYEDHIYAPKWFASTIGRSFKDFGYTISTQRSEPQHDQQSGGSWTGLIISTLPKSGTWEEIEKADSYLVPFPKKGDEIQWTQDKQMYKELLNVTDIVLEKISFDVPGHKETFSPGDALNLRIQLSNNFNRNVYFGDGIWGFAKNRKLTGCVWLSTDGDFTKEEALLNAIPISSTGIWGSTQVRFDLAEENETHTEAVASLRIPKRAALEEKFKRSWGEFHLLIDIGGPLSENRSFYDLNEEDNFGSIKIRIE